MTVVLAFDTSLNSCGLAVYDSQSGKSVTERVITDRGQAEMLVPMIKALLEKSGHSFEKIDRIAITTGPGSFTGLRVGLSTARHLGLSLNKPVLGLPTLDLLSMQAPPHEGKKLLCAIDTKRGDFYVKIEGRIPGIFTFKEVEAILAKDDIVFIGDPGQQIPQTLTYPDPEILAKWAAEQVNIENKYAPEHAPQPVYMREAEVSQSKRIYHTLQS